MFDEIFRESTSTLLAEIANLKTITGRFSEFSKMPQPNFQRVNVNDVVRGVARLFEAQLKSRQYPIDCRLELQELPNVAADPDLLHKGLSNLVLNAIDAMPNGGELTIRTGRSGERIRLQVSDTGVGLTPEECEHLFTPYYTSKQHGSGLGLAIVQSVISDHGGRITVASTPAHGTSFQIELPLNLEKLGEAGQSHSGTSNA
jgi:two-component system, NtrC family, nitrogen regulation sensor histidine kinase NtrY